MPVNPEMLPNFADFEFARKKTNCIALLASTDYCILSSWSCAIAVGFTLYRRRDYQSGIKSTALKFQYRLSSIYPVAPHRLARWFIKLQTDNRSVTNVQLFMCNLLRIFMYGCFSAEHT